MLFYGVEDADVPHWRAEYDVRAIYALADVLNVPLWSWILELKRNNVIDWDGNGLFRQGELDNAFVRTLVHRPTGSEAFDVFIPFKRLAASKLGHHY